MWHTRNCQYPELGQRPEAGVNPEMLYNCFEVVENARLRRLNTTNNQRIGSCSISGHFLTRSEKDFCHIQSRRAQ